MFNENPKSINGVKRDALDTIVGAARVLCTININRADANIELFKTLVTELAVNANELILLAEAIESQKGA